MRNWPAQDVEARFSECLDACLQEGPQMITRRGEETAVLVPSVEWRRLQGAPRPTLKELLLAPAPRAEIPVPKRGGLRWRPPPVLD